MPEFFVPSRPAPQGSKSFKGMRKGKPVLAESSKGVKPFRAAIAKVAALHSAPLPGPVSVTLRFVMPRPQATPKTRPTPPAVKRPDLDKLTRAVLDGIDGHAYDADSQVTHLDVRKRIAELGEKTGVLIAWRPDRAYGLDDVAVGG
ncbi:RusA family crossover junction endodeoxyribonuclease [Prescottella equi]|uniref:RusA family crossover junction endodeoxyribonuclease n=1 Tax=Rhodococcus hoagii TaxID=43767 RepID=UPI000D111874|nr:RusA family crossover junction endodeoxyribonuclease [Prescottella equi]AVP71266.1 RusA family crossover junction endodeoxyribonuclease [Prescottella equi]